MRSIVAAAGSAEGTAGAARFSPPAPGDHGGSTATSPSHLQRSSGGSGSGKRPLAPGQITPLVLKAQPVLLPSVFPEHLRSPFPYKPKSGGGNPGGSSPAKCGPGTGGLPGHGVPYCGGV